MFAGAEDRMYAVEPVDRRTARSGGSLVAGIGRVSEVIAASALQKVSAGSRHISKLWRSPRKECLGEHRILLLDHCVMRKVAVANHCANLQPTIGSSLD